jgi:hypothetical protein
MIYICDLAAWFAEPFVKAADAYKQMDRLVRDRWGPVSLCCLCFIRDVYITSSCLYMHDLVSRAFC